MKTEDLAFTFVAGIIILSGCTQFMESDMNMIMSAQLDKTVVNVGDSVNVAMTVNLEYPEPVSTTIEAYMDGQPYKSYDANLVSGENNITDVWGPFLDNQAGEHVVTFEADKENLLAELNEDDNRAMTSLNVRVPEGSASVTNPELKIPTYPADPSTPVNAILQSFLTREMITFGDVVTATSMVKIESDKTETFNLSLDIYVNGVRNSECFKKFTTKKMPTGEHYASGAIPCPLDQTPFGAPGKYTLTYVLDEKNSIAENKETDNMFDKYVTILPE